jgi:hypothetical protein
MKFTIKSIIQICTLSKSKSQAQALHVPCITKNIFDYYMYSDESVLRKQILKLFWSRHIPIA